MSTLLAAHLLHLKAGGMSPNTIHDRERLLKVLDRDLPQGIDRATTDDLKAWLARDGWSAWTRATYYRHIRGFYRWALGGEKPWPDADMPRPRNPDADPHPATDEQVRLALDRSDEWWQRAISLAAYAGLRASECANLKREDVTAESVRVEHGKGDRSKTLPCHPEIWRRIGPLPPGLVLPGRFGQVVNDLSSRARPYFNRLGLPELHLHMFRHWYCCTLLRGGTDIRTVQSLMRHKNLQTTALYLELVDGQRSKAIRSLPVLHSVQQEAQGAPPAAA